jgi:hypothetical protein
MWGREGPIPTFGDVMPDPTYNCPFSANASGAGSSDDVLTCAELLALNTNAGCPLYNQEQEECQLRLFFGRDIETNGLAKNLPTTDPSP